jgi:hypothetical protein
MLWTPEEKKFLKSLNSAPRIQGYLDQLTYNAQNSACSARYTMITNEGHCFEGCLVAAAALEFQGYVPLMVHLIGHNDDYHALTVYRTKSGWGAFSKSNTTLLAGRLPVYLSVRELVMSYFDFYHNVKGQPSLYSFSQLINLNRFNHWNWRTSDEDLMEMGMEMSQLKHFECTDLRTLKKLPRVSQRVQDACFLGADPAGLFTPED